MTRNRALLVATLIGTLALAAPAQAYRAPTAARAPTADATLPALAPQRLLDSGQVLLADAPRARRRAPRTRLGLRKRFSRMLGSQRMRSTRLGRAVRALTRRPKVLTPAQAAKLIKSGDHVFMPVGHTVATTVLDALSSRVRAGQLSAKRPVRIVGLKNTVDGSLFRGSKGKIVPHSLFLGSATRDNVAAGQGSFVPVFLSRVPRLIREGKIKVDKALLQVSPPDKLGFVTLGPSVGTTLAALDRAKMVIAEVNPNVPRTNGAARVHISRIDAIVRSNRPLKPLTAPKIGSVERKIAKNIVKLVPKKATLQFGIGAIPDAVAGLLAKAGRRDLRVHSEMISDGVMNLVKAGAVRGKVRYSFAEGTAKFIKWMHKNRKLKAYPTDFINAHKQLAKIKNMVAINSALRVDLKGQINAQHVPGRGFYSGVGGQVDFMRGAMASPGGRAILALPAIAMVPDGKGGKKPASRIVPRLGEGDVVTTSMHDVQFVVTEYGVAKLEGKSTVERARALIKIAAPQFRKQLTRDLDRQLAAQRTAARKRLAK